MPLALIASVFAPAYRLLRYRSAWLLFVTILVAGSVPGARAEIGQMASGLVLHAGAYAFITFLLVTGGRGSLEARAIKAVLTVSLMGAVDELVQSFLPYRTGALADWLIDFGSATVTAGVMYALARRDRDALAALAADGSDAPSR